MEKKIIVLVLSFLLVTPLVFAAGPSLPGSGAAGDRLDPFNSRMYKEMINQPLGGTPVKRSTSIDVAYKYFDLSEEKLAKIDRLEGTRVKAVLDNMEEFLAQLDVKYRGLVAEVLSPEERETYNTIIELESERKDAIAEAKEEYDAVLSEVRASQGMGNTPGPPFMGTKREDTIRRFVKLSPEQQKEADELRRNRSAMWREALNSIPKPKERKDIQAHRDYAIARRDLRKKMDEESSQAMEALLTDEQIAICEKVEAALQTYVEKGEAAFDAADQKLVELIGEERLQASKRIMLPLSAGPIRRSAGGRPPSMMR